jgi:hypothetical protein
VPALCRTATSGVIERTLRFGCHSALPGSKTSNPRCLVHSTLLPGAGAALLVHAASMAPFTGAMAGGCVGIHGGTWDRRGIVPMMLLQRLRRGLRWWSRALERRVKLAP